VCGSGVRGDEFERFSRFGKCEKTAEKKRADVYLLREEDRLVMYKRQG